MAIFSAFEVAQSGTTSAQRSGTAGAHTVPPYRALLSLFHSCMDIARLCAEGNLSMLAVCEWAFSLDQVRALRGATLRTG